MKKFLTIILCIAGILTGCGGSGNITAENTDPSEKTTSKDSILHETNSDEFDFSTETLLPIGEIADIGEWSIVVTETKILDSISSNFGTLTPDDDTRFMVVTVSVTNNGNVANYFLPSVFMDDDISATVIYNDNYEYPPTNLLNYEKSLYDLSLNPLTTKEGEIIFSIPPSVTDSNQKLVLQFKTGSSSVTFSLR